MGNGATPPAVIASEAACGLIGTTGKRAFGLIKMTSNGNVQWKTYS